MHGRSVSTVTAYTAHREWAKRPPDERYASVHALAEAARARRNRTDARITETVDLQVQAATAKLRSSVTGDAPVPLDAIPDLSLTTDLIVGFPGEREEDFAQTLEVCEEVGYDSAFTFVYSPRRGTEAAAITEGVVPHEVKVERMQRLVEVVQRRAHERAQRFVGRTLDVLVEGPSRTDPSRVRGRSRHNKAVNFTGLARPGEIVPVEIHTATSQTLAGEESLVSRATAA